MEEDEIIVHYDWEEEEKKKEENKEEKEEQKEKTQSKDKKSEKKKPKKKDKNKKKTKKKKKSTNKKTKKSKKNNSDSNGNNNSNKKYLIAGSLIAIGVVLIVSFFFMRTGEQDVSNDRLLVAKVNNEQITLSELNNAYKITVPVQLQNQVTKEQFLETTLIPRALLQQEAEGQGIEVSDDEVNQLMDSFMEQAQITREKYLERLSTGNITLTEIKEYYRSQIMVSKLLNQSFGSQLEVTEREIEKYYNENKELFTADPNEIRAAHILVNDTEEAKEIYDLLQEGANFEELVVERSMDPTAITNQGDLGFFGKGVMVEEFEEAAFNLSVNEISLPVETQFGYHIILRKTDTIPLEEAKESITNALRSSKQNALLETYINQLKSGADIEIYFGQKDLPVIEKNTERSTFEETGDDICLEENKPVVRMYSTTGCSSCNWIGETFDNTVNEFVEKGDIKAYHWQLDTGDNALTERTETAIPKSEFEIFKKYNPKSTVPTFVFGCKYIRIGNVFQEQNNLEAEREEFRKIIKKLTN